MKKNNWVPLAAAVGAVAGVFYLITNSRTVRATAYRGVSSVADRAGVDLPDGVREFVLAPPAADPRFGVGTGWWAGDAWMQPNPYAGTGGPTPGYAPPSGGTTFGVSLG